MEPRFAIREDRIPGVTQSWRSWYEAREAEEWIQSVSSVLEQGWNDQWAFFNHPTGNLFLNPLFRQALHRGAKQYEFPTGYNYYFGPERFTIGELFFNHPSQMQVMANVLFLLYESSIVL